MQKRNYVIDLMRFLFCAMIVFHHSYVMYGGYVYAPTGYMGVEFFFIITGFYMMNEVERMDIQELDGHGVHRIILRKIAKIMPILFFSIIASGILQYISGINKDIVGNYVYAIPELLMLQMFGVGSTCPTGSAWYLSATFMVQALLYPLLMRHKLAVRIYSPLVVLALLGTVLCNAGNIGSDPGIYIGRIPKGVLRAFAEVLIGIILYSVVRHIKDINDRWRYLLGGIEICCYLGTAYIAYKFQAGLTDLYALILIVIGVTVTLSEKSIWYKLFNFKIWGVLGKFSAVWFLNNYYVARCIPSLFPQYQGTRLLFVYFAASFVIALLVWAMVILSKFVCRKILETGRRHLSREGESDEKSKCVDTVL